MVGYKNSEGIFGNSKPNNKAPNYPPVLFSIFSIDTGTANPAGIKDIFLLTPVLLKCLVSYPTRDSPHYLACRK